MRSLALRDHRSRSLAFADKAAAQTQPCNHECHRQCELLHWGAPLLDGCMEPGYRGGCLVQKYHISHLSAAISYKLKLQLPYGFLSKSDSPSDGSVAGSAQASEWRPRWPFLPVHLARSAPGFRRAMTPRTARSTIAESSIVTGPRPALVFRVSGGDSQAQPRFAPPKAAFETTVYRAPVACRASSRGYFSV
jgi:hypothetical protein